MIKLQSRDQEAHIAQIEEESLTINEEAFLDGKQKSCEQKIYLLGLPNTTCTTGMGKRLLNRCYSKSLCDKPTGFNMLQTNSMSSATSVSGFGNQTATQTSKSSHLQVTTRFFIPLKTIQDVDISISIIPVFKQVNDVGYNDPSVIDKRVSRKNISLNTTANGIVGMVVEGLNKYLGGETFMLINLHHLPSVHYIIEQSSILIPFLSIVLKQIVVQEAEEPKKMVWFLCKKHQRLPFLRTAGLVLHYTNGGHLVE
ncbi:hypothetical protein AAC387_Pa04g1311 [Persea americana]